MITKAYKFCTILGLTLLAGGCAFTPHEVSLTATAPNYSTDIGKGATVGLRFIDDRDTKTVGQRGAGMVGSDISASNLVLHVENQVTGILRSNGFKVVDYNDANEAKVTVSLRTFKFFIETGFWTGAKNVDVSLKADARNGGRDFLNNYAYNQEERVLVIPDGSGIDSMMNTALTDVLTKLSVDKELMKFLAGK
jgi:uncharacterized lipoprotein YajG